MYDISVLNYYNILNLFDILFIIIFYYLIIERKKYIIFYIKILIISCFEFLFLHKFHNLSFYLRGCGRILIHIFPSFLSFTLITKET